MADNLLTYIQSLRAQIAQLEAEKARAETLLNQYAQLFWLHVGELFEQWTQLRAVWAARQATRTRRRSDAERADEWGNRVQETAIPDIKAPVEPPKPTVDEAAELKKLYRQAVIVAHPDRYAQVPARHAAATAFMAQLNAAYEQQDLLTVRRLAQDAADGLLFLDLENEQTDPETLTRLQVRLTERRDALATQLQALQQQEGYALMINGTDLNAYFATLRQTISHQITELMRQLSP